MNGRMPYAIEYYSKGHPMLGSDTSKIANRAIIVNTQTGHHFSTEPIPVEKAKAQLRVLEAAARKKGEKV